MTTHETLYRVIDNDGLNTLSWTIKNPTTRGDIVQSLRNHHRVYGKSLSTSRSAYIMASPLVSGLPTLEQLLQAYNLTIEEAK